MGCYESKQAADRPQDAPVQPSFHDYYLQGTKLGSGSFATVYECTDSATGKMAAVKIVHRKSLTHVQEMALKAEVEILRSLDHPGVVKLYDVIETSENVYIVMELAKGGDLFDRIAAKTTYNEMEARDVVKSMLKTLKYCHANNVAHCDIKPENLLLETSECDTGIKVADFGFAQRVGNGKMLKRCCGSIPYVAPEILRGKPYDTKVDIWSAGVITYCLLCGRPPFLQKSTTSTIRRIMFGQLTFSEPAWENVSESAKDFIRKILVLDLTSRPTAVQLLEHPWMSADGRSLSNRDLSVAALELRTTRGQLRFRAAVNVVMVVNQLNPPSSDEAGVNVDCEQGTEGTLQLIEETVTEAAALDLRQ